MRAPPVTKVGPTTVQYKFVANDYIRIQGSVVSWQDRRISRLAASMATRTGTEQAGRWAKPAGDRDRSRRHRKAVQRAASGGPQHTGQAAPAHRRSKNGPASEVPTGCSKLDRPWAEKCDTSGEIQTVLSSSNG